MVRAVPGLHHGDSSMTAAHDTQALAEKLGFVIDPPGTACRCIRWADSGARPASVAEEVMWDALTSRLQEQAEPESALTMSMFATRRDYEAAVADQEEKESAELQRAARRVARQEQEGQPALAPLTAEERAHVIGVLRRNHDEEFINRIRATLAAGSQAVQVPGWIDINDRLPPAATHVIAFGQPYGDRTRRHKVYVTYISTRPRECVEDEEITHWSRPPAAPLQPLAGGEVHDRSSD